MENMSAKRKWDGNEEEGDVKKLKRGDDGPELLVEVRPLDERLPRILELLQERCDKSSVDKIVIFVRSDDQCDDLATDLVRRGYPRCLTIHDFDNDEYVESTIFDFKTSSSNHILIATCFAAKNLDVRELQLVIHFDLPTCFKEYVLRVGKTRCKRRTVTFISRDTYLYSPHLVFALEELNQVVPGDLMRLAEFYVSKLDPGLYVEREEKEFVVPKKPQGAAANGYAAMIWDYVNTPKIQDKSLPEYYEEELEISGFPQYARWKVTHIDTIIPIIESTGVVITTLFGDYQPDRIPPIRRRKPYLSITGPTEQSVKTATAELKRVLEETTLALSLPISLPGNSSVSLLHGN